MVIINDILDISKLEVGKLELEHIPIHLPSQLDQVRKTLQFKAEDKGLNFDVSIDPKVPEHILGDPTRLKQILINLCGNAIKFTDAGRVDVSVNLKGENLEFRVRDTGIGIKESQKQQLFSSFQQADKSTTRKYGGTGLGLSISKTLVEMMGGDIEVVSELNG